VHGGVQTIEYSDMTDDQKVDAEGNAVLPHGTFGVCIFDLAFLARVNAEEGLPWHQAIKAVKRPDGTVTDQKAYKFERFVFDTMISLRRPQAVPFLLVDRDREFAPLKNREGVDSPETVSELVRSNLLRVGRSAAHQAGLPLPVGCLPDIPWLFDEQGLVDRLIESGQWSDLLIC
ncbi:hypothetical protein KIPB_005954, partial [Kipferlia bialata]